MKTEKRWIKAVIEASKSDIPEMPWARGARRAAFIAKRRATDQAKMPLSA